jgi:hypothetical protein
VITLAKTTQPAAKFRLGFVTATVWLNDKHYNTVLSRSYKDGDEYKDTDQLGTGDLMNAVRVLQRADDFIASQS